MHVKKVAALHDIAGFGRSSLTVIIPTLSVLGHQTCPVPTAVLSTITGFYDRPEMQDLTTFLPQYLAHWEREKFAFDCIYTGFLGAATCTDIAAEFIDRAASPLVVVDPVFADDGRLYACFDDRMVAAMNALVRRAHIITPNLTEAQYLTDCDSTDGAELARRLSRLTDGDIVITGVPRGEHAVSVFVLTRAENRLSRIDNPYVHARYPGTGDLFTAVLTGAVLGGMSVEDGAAKAADFVFTAIKTAYENGVPVREGVPLELMVPRLLEHHALEIYPCANR